MNPRRRIVGVMAVLAMGAAASALSGCALFMPSSDSSPPALVSPQADPEPAPPAQPIPRPPRPKPAPLAAMTAPTKPVTATPTPDTVVMLPPAQTSNDPGAAAGNQEGPAPAAAAPGRAPAPVATDVNAERILGLDAGALRRSLGTPQAQLDFPPARVWRYAAASCTFDVYFYMDVKSREFRVLHYEATANDGSERQKDQCYQRVLAEQHGPSRSSGLVEATGRAD